MTPMMMPFGLPGGPGSAIDGANDLPPGAPSGAPGGVVSEAPDNDAFAAFDVALLAVLDRAAGGDESESVIGGVATADGIDEPSLGDESVLSALWMRAVAVAQETAAPSMRSTGRSAPKGGDGQSAPEPSQGQSGASEDLDTYLPLTVAVSLPATAPRQDIFVAPAPGDLQAKPGDDNVARSDAPASAAGPVVLAWSQDTDQDVPGLAADRRAGPTREDDSAGPVGVPAAATATDERAASTAGQRAAFVARHAKADSNDLAGLDSASAQQVTTAGDQPIARYDRQGTGSQDDARHIRLVVGDGGATVAATSESQSQAPSRAATSAGAGESARAQAEMAIRTAGTTNANPAVQGERAAALSRRTAPGSLTQELNGVAASNTGRDASGPRAVETSSVTASAATAATTAGHQSTPGDTHDRHGTGQRREAELAGWLRRSSTLESRLMPMGFVSPTLGTLASATQSALTTVQEARVAYEVPAAAANLSRIVQSMRVQARDGVSEATVRLDPTHLGEVSIAVRVENGTVTAMVHAASGEVRQWLRDQEAQIRASLAEQGLALDRFVVDQDGERQEAQPKEAPQPRKPRAKASSGPDAPTFDVTV